MLSRRRCPFQPSWMSVGRSGRRPVRLGGCRRADGCPSRGVLGQETARQATAKMAPIRIRRRLRRGRGGVRSRDRRHERGQHLQRELERSLQTRALATMRKTWPVVAVTMAHDGSDSRQCSDCCGSLEHSGRPGGPLPVPSVSIRLTTLGSRASTGTRASQPPFCAVRSTICVQPTKMMFHRLAKRR